MTTGRVPGCRPPQSRHECEQLLLRLRGEQRYDPALVWVLTDHYLDLWVGWAELEVLDELRGALEGVLTFGVSV